MLIPQTAESGKGGRQGSPPLTLAELRRALAKPSVLDDGHRRRLLDLAQRLARVQALGDEYARVRLSPRIRSVLARCRVLS
jgi:hypothetical protein